MRSGTVAMQKQIKRKEQSSAPVPTVPRGARRAERRADEGSSNAAGTLRDLGLNPLTPASAGSPDHQPQPMIGPKDTVVSAESRQGLS